MGHLSLIVVVLELSTDQAGLAHRQLRHEVILMGVKEHQGQIAGIVETVHPVRHAPVLGRRGVMLAHGHGNGDDNALGRGRDRRPQAPVDHRIGQVPQKIDNVDRYFRIAVGTLVQQSAEGLFDLGADTLQCPDA